MNSIVPFARASLPNTTAQPGMPASPEAKKYIVANLIYPILQTFTGGQSVSKEEITGTVALWTDVLTGFQPEAYAIAARMMLMERKDRFRPVPAEVREYLERAEAQIQGRPWRSRFAPSDHLETIAYNRIRGEHGNMILDAVPEASTADVAATLVEISDKFKSPGIRYSETSDDVPIKDITGKAISHLRKKVLYRIYGEPERCAGGKAALSSTWCAITQQRIGGWRAEFPKAIRNHEEENYLSSRFQELATADPNAHERYGRGLQEEIETRLRGWMASQHDAHVKQEEEERLRGEERRRKEEEARQRQEAIDRQWKREAALRDLESQATEASLRHPDVAPLKARLDQLCAMNLKCTETEDARSSFAAAWFPILAQERKARGLPAEAF
jgi:hypothetical protein